MQVVHDGDDQAQARLAKTDDLAQSEQDTLFVLLHDLDRHRQQDQHDDHDGNQNNDNDPRHGSGS